MSRQKLIKLEFRDYEYQCGDGCCTNYGTKTTFNGVEMECQNDVTNKQVIIEILEHLGYTVEVV